MLEGLCHCGERLREALRGASLLRFTVSPASISTCFWGAWLCFCLFVFGLCLFGLVFFLVFHVFEIFLVVLRSRTTVGAVMARTAWEKKNTCLVQSALLCGTIIPDPQFQGLSVVDTMPLLVPSLCNGGLYLSDVKFGPSFGCFRGHGYLATIFSGEEHMRVQEQG